VYGDLTDMSANSTGFISRIDNNGCCDSGDDVSEAVECCNLLLTLLLSANGIVIKGHGCALNAVERDRKTQTQGGYSDKIVVDEKYVLRIPDNLPMDRSAPLLCAGVTLYSPLMHWKVGPGKRVAIIGLGGLGHIGVKFAHALGAEVTVLSHSLEKEEVGKRMGADNFYSTADPSTFKKLRGYPTLSSTPYQGCLIPTDT
jgi:D-arabinose 1-dehydrogenase-like Zn-dependent alcohol dehydrogenase